MKKKAEFGLRVQPKCVFATLAAVSLERVLPDLPLCFQDEEILLIREVLTLILSPEPSNMP